MNNTYSEQKFAIDLIMDTFNTTNPDKIVDYCNNKLDVIVTKSEVLDHINSFLNEDYEKESRKQSLLDKFIETGEL